jgi:multiple sugar transport system substrate-binding protein
MSRKYSRLLLSLVLIVLLVGLTAARVNAKTELQVTWWGSQNRHDRTIKIIEMYMAAHPDVTITYEFSVWNDYWPRVNTQAAGGGLPCVMQQDYAYVQEWAKRGLLLPLDDFIKAKTLDTSKIADASLDGGRVDGKLYAVNLGNNSQSFLLDADAFKKAGIELPSAQWTWPEFEKIVMQLHDKLGIYGMGTGLEDVQLWKSLYLSLGQWAFSDDGTKLGYEDDKPLIDYFSMILRLQKAGAIPPASEAVQMMTQSVEQLPIVTGKAAMAYLWSNQVVALWTAAGEKRNFRLWHVPRPEGGKAENYIKPSQFFSITSKCSAPEEAAKFIDFVTNSLEANEILFAERGIPISSAVREHLTPRLTPSQAETFDFLARVEKDNSAIRPPDPPGYGDIVNNVYNPQFWQPILYGQITPEEGAKLLREQASEILAKNKASK